MLEIQLSDENDFGDIKRQELEMKGRQDKIIHIHNIYLDSRLSTKTVFALLTATSLDGEIISMAFGDALSLKAADFTILPTVPFLVRSLYRNPYPQC